MRRELVQSSGFARHLRRWLKKHPAASSTVQVIIAALSEDAFDPSLGTHKLKGKWASYFACWAGYNSRIIFEFFNNNGTEAIQLVTIGTHVDVY